MQRSVCVVALIHSSIHRVKKQSSKSCSGAYLCACSVIYLHVRVCSVLVMDGWGSAQGMLLNAAGQEEAECQKRLLRKGALLPF